MRLFRVAGFAFLLASVPFAAHAEEGPQNKRAKVGDLTSFGPVALGSGHALRLCHANHFGNRPVTVEWVFVALAPPDPTAPPVGQPTKVVGQLIFELDPGTGNCAEFAPDLSQHPDTVSIIAILIGLLRNGNTTTNVVGSAQLVERTATGSNAIGLLLPAVKKTNVQLPAVQLPVPE